MFFTTSSSNPVQVFKSTVSKYTLPLMFVATQSQTQNPMFAGITEEVVLAAMNQPGGQYW